MSLKAIDDTSDSADTFSFHSLSASATSSDMFPRMSVLKKFTEIR